MTRKKGHQNFRRIEIEDFGVKFLKKVVLKFFCQMCSDEFFLKHALDTRPPWATHFLHLTLSIACSSAVFHDISRPLKSFLMVSVQFCRGLPVLFLPPGTQCT